MTTFAPALSRKVRKSIQKKALATSRDLSNKELKVHRHIELTAVSNSDIRDKQKRK